MAMANVGAGAALLFLSSCGPGWWTSSLGVRMDESPGFLPTYFTPSQVDAAAAHMLLGMVALGYPEEVLRGGLRAELVQVLPGPTLPGCRCAGQQVGDVLRVATQPCVWDTALSHEMAHHLRERLTGDADPGHRDAALWALTRPLGTCP